MVDGIEGGLAGVYERDLPRASRLLERAATGARQAGNLDGELLARAQLGLVLVSSGRVGDGMRLLDGAAAAAVSGEIADPSSAVAVCCMLTMACLAVRDLERAAQWSRYAMDTAASRGGGTLFDYPRTDRAALLIWQGRWEEADKELRGVLDAAAGWTRPRPDVFWLLPSAGSSAGCVPGLPCYGRGNDQENDQTDPWKPPNHGDLSIVTSCA
jgi:hypothetical protein